MAKQLTILVALAIGASLVLSNLYVPVETLPETLASPEQAPFALLHLVPPLIALLFAYLLYRYARNIKVDESADTYSAMMFAGIKLFGLYLAINGVPVVLSRSILIYDDPADIYYYSHLIVGIFQLAVSYLLIFRTNRMVQFLSP